MSTIASKRPSRVNAVSVFLTLALLAAIYAGVQFGPPYWRKWQVKGVLEEAANEIYPKRMVTGDPEAEFLRQLEEQTINKLRQAGVEDPGLQVRIVKTPEEGTVAAEYVEQINHPLVNKTTVLHFRPYNTVPFK